MTLAKLTFALVIAGATATSVLAGEPRQYGSVKDGGYGGIPVPAPMPVPETFNWYVRVDMGVGVTQGGAVREEGFQYGLSGCGACWTAAAPFGMTGSQFTTPGWLSGSSDSHFQGGIGFGKYLSPQFRMDVTLDSKTKDRTGGTGEYSYAEYTAPTLPAPGGVPTGMRIDGTTTERIDVLDTVLMANAYYDLVPRGRLTPYIGFGAGFAARTIDRRHQTDEERIDPLTGTVLASRSWSADSRDIKFAPAVSATAGLAWAITPSTVLDVNYRYTYLGEVDSTMQISVPGGASQASKIIIDAAHQHAIRAGLRVNVW